MAKRYSVASPSTGTGGANVLYAGGGRVGGGGIPKAAPGGFSIDLGLDKMRQKTEDDEKRKYLISGGLDPKAVALMDTQSLEMGVRAMSDDLIRAKEKELEVSNANLIGELFKNMGRITTESAFGGSDLGGESGVGKGHGEVTGEPASDWADREFETTEGLASAEDLQDTIAEEDDLAKMPDDLFNPLDALKPPKSKPVDAISALIQDFPSHLLTKEIYAKARQAKMDVTPKEVDPWANAKGMMVGNDWVDFGRDGKELRRIRDLPKDIDWQEIKGWIGDKQGSFFRDKDDPNVYIMDGDEPKFHPVPKGFSRVRPRSEKSLSMKFNAFLEMNDDYKGLIPTPKVLLDPKDLYLTGNPTEQKAAIEFFKTEDGAVALIKAITELQKTRNKGDEARRTKIEKLIKQKEGR